MPWRKQLNGLLNPNGGVTRPVKVVQPGSLGAAAACGMRTTFGHLRDDPWMELMFFLDHIGPQNRFWLSGRSVTLARDEN
jgi:hypothetical protein